MLNAFLLRSYQPLQTYCLHVLPTGPPQMVLWCRRSGRQRPQPLHRHGFSQKESTLLYIALHCSCHRRSNPSHTEAKETNTPMPRKIPEISPNSNYHSAAWQLVQLQLVPLAREQAGVHPARKEKINKPLQRIPDRAATTQLCASTPLDLPYFLLRSYQPLQTYCLHVLPTGPPQMVLWCRRSGRQRPSLYTGMGSAKRNQHCSTLLMLSPI